MWMCMLKPGATRFNNDNNINSSQQLYKPIDQGSKRGTIQSGTKPNLVPKILATNFGVFFL